MLKHCKISTYYSGLGTGSFVVEVFLRFLERMLKPMKGRKVYSGRGWESSPQSQAGEGLA